MFATTDHGLARLWAIGAGLLLVFSIWPELDLWVSDVFRFGTHHFPLAQDPLLADLRQIVWTFGLAVVAVCAALAGLKVLYRLAAGGLAWGSRSCPLVQATGFFVLGPGIIVNGLLKNGWARARPADVAGLGGDGTFTQAFHMMGSCSRNCSFVSGEAALAMAVGLVLWHMARQAGLAGQKLAASLGVFVSLTCLMRVATGRHFLSDVLFACLFMALLARVMLRSTQPSAMAAQGGRVAGGSVLVGR